MLVMRRNNPGLLDAWFNTFDANPNNENTSRNGKHTRGAVPAANITKDDNSWSIYLSVPSCTKEDFSIKVEEQILTITKETEKEKTEEKTDAFLIQEFHVGDFSRSFELPEEADTEKISAKYENGILNVRIEKKIKQECIKTISVN